MADAGAPSGTRRARPRTRRPDGCPAAVGLVLFFAAPLGAFFVYSFLSNSLYEVARPFTLEAYSDALTTDVNRTLAVNSLVVGFCSAAATVIVGLPSPTGCGSRRGACRSSSSS